MQETEQTPPEFLKKLAAGNDEQSMEKLQNSFFSNSSPKHFQQNNANATFIRSSPKQSPTTAANMSSSQTQKKTFTFRQSAPLPIRSLLLDWETKNHKIDEGARKSFTAANIESFTKQMQNLALNNRGNESIGGDHRQPITKLENSNSISAPKGFAAAQTLHNHSNSNAQAAHNQVHIHAEEKPTPLPRSSIITSPSPQQPQQLAASVLPVVAPTSKGRVEQLEHTPLKSVNSVTTAGAIAQPQAPVVKTLQFQLNAIGQNSAAPTQTSACAAPKAPSAPSIKNVEKNVEKKVVVTTNDADDWD